jgi:hypothetical protein
MQARALPSLHRRSNRSQTRLRGWLRRPRRRSPRCNPRRARRSRRSRALVGQSGQSTRSLQRSHRRSRSRAPRPRRSRVTCRRRRRAPAGCPATSSASTRRRLKPARRRARFSWQARQDSIARKTGSLAIRWRRIGSGAQRGAASGDWRPRPAATSGMPRPYRWL